MSTFYIQGCNNENSTLEYFDSIYLPVQKLIDMDADVQESLYKLLISEDELDSNNNTEQDSSLLDIVELENKISDLKRYIKTHIAKIHNIQVVNNEDELKQSYEHLLKIYLYEINVNWIQLISIIKLEEVSAKDMKHFNDILQKTQLNLDSALNQFYNTAENYANKYNIEIEKEF